MEDIESHIPLPPTSSVCPLNDLIPPFIDVNSGVAPKYSNVMYGDPGTRYAVMVAASWKYWTVTAWVSKPVALWFAKSPWCSEKDVHQSICVGCLIDVLSNSRLPLIPYTTPLLCRADSYGNGPAAVPFPGEAAYEAHHVFVGYYV
jgi:hypothetical protein